MSKSAGTPSAELAGLLAVGGAGVTTALVSMAARHPEGGDAEYLAWHALDHRPELHRVPALRGGLRLVSTPACRAARAVGGSRYDEVDHVMAYLFADRGGLYPFRAAAGALAAGGRMGHSLPTVELGLHELVGAAAAPRIKAGADVLPWRPARGGYLLVEEGAAPADDLVDVPGVAGAWWFAGRPGDPFPGDATGLQLTWCFLDDDPVATAGRLADVVAKRWVGGGPVPLLAAPFEVVVPYEWERALP